MASGYSSPSSVSSVLSVFKPATGRPFLGPTFERFRFLAPCQRLRVIVCVLSAYLREDESSTCVCLRLREQCLRSEITSVSRVANVLLLRFVAGNMDASTKSRPVCAFVFQLPNLRGNARTQGSTCGRQ